jgi:7-carboxy-7-deazaguanine synthase
VAVFGSDHVVITGGEPLIAPDIAELAETIGATGAHITIETAGTVFQELRCDLMSISPKLANSTPWERDQGRWAVQHERLRFKPNVLRQLMDAYPCQLKFVVSSASDVEEIAQMQQQLTAPAEKIILMPEGVNRGVLRERGLWLAEICKERGYRFSPRLHIELWGDRRGI